MLEALVTSAAAEAEMLHIIRLSIIGSDRQHHRQMAHRLSNLIDS